MRPVHIVRPGQGAKIGLFLGDAREKRVQNCEAGDDCVRDHGGDGVSSVPP